MNEDPNNPTTIESGLLLADIIRNSQNTLYDNFVGADMGSCWSQQLSKVQYNDEERYTPRQSILSMVWNDMYEDVIGDAESMYQLAVTEENKNMQAVALIIKAYGFGVLTDCYGAIPCTEALQAKTANFQPAYDEQSVVYDKILAFLDEADGLLSATGGTINASSDIMYGGDWTKWKKFGNSLKFRSLMRISAARDVSADLQKLASANGMFTSNANEAKLIYLSDDPNANPMYENIVFGTRLEFKLNEVLVEKLKSNSDPRLTVYVAKNEDGEYRGKPGGISNVPNDDYSYANVSPIGALYLLPEAPAYLMSYSELQFLMAEAVTKGYITGTAQTYYTNGINASMAANGIDSYTGTNGTLAVNIALKQIAEENWIALFCQGVESWTEQRRTGFPVLTPVQDGAISEIPSRYKYPNTEQSLNATGYNGAVSSQGADLLTTKLWWNK